jgi:hypothetical protein
VAEKLTELSYPAPRALRDLRGCRRELVKLFREAKSGLIEPQLFGRLVNCLNTLQALDNGRLLEERLLEVERRLGAAKPNGHDTSTGARL